jgi:hypothetical protein
LQIGRYEVFSQQQEVHLTQGHITLNCTDIAGLDVITTGTAKEA